jgi:antitoxin component of MazEF toxin-antitoxin module
MMIATVRNFGDSLGVQFPKALLRNVSISENDDVEFLVRDNIIIIKRRECKRHRTTKERIDAFGDAMNDAPVTETDWGKPQGKEIW